MEEATKDKNPHLSNLVSKITEDFTNKVEAEKDISNVLLKGHLLIENILEEALSVLDSIPSEGMDRASFYRKVKELEKVQPKDTGISESVKAVVPSLFSLNKLRNDLAHDLNFNVSESGVNKVGLTLGSKFIMHKYETGHKNARENLIFCLDDIVHQLGFIIYQQITSLTPIK